MKAKFIRLIPHEGWQLLCRCGQTRHAWADRLMPFTKGKPRLKSATKRGSMTLGPIISRPSIPSVIPRWDMALKALKEGGHRNDGLNAANEEAVHLFLEGKIPFLDIEHACSLALANFPNIMRPTLRDILTTDAL
jgi:hypothetical protein